MPILMRLLLAASEVRSAVVEVLDQVAGIMRQSARLDGGAERVGAAGHLLDLVARALPTAGTAPARGSGS